MAEKIKVTLEVEPGKTYTIKPLGEKLAEPAPESAGGDNENLSVTGTVTATVNPLGGDVDVDVDF
jgi:hypothetical protein